MPWYNIGYVSFFFVQVNLVDGLPSILYNETCTAGAGTIILEFGILSRLLGDPVFENFARKAVEALWKRRSLETGLLGEFTLYTLTSVCIFSILFPICFLRCWQGEFVEKSILGVNRGLINLFTPRSDQKWIEQFVNNFNPLNFASWFINFSCVLWTSRVDYNASKLMKRASYC